jgi:hypothetical protein
MKCLIKYLYAIPLFNTAVPLKTLNRRFNNRFIDFTKMETALAWK